MFPFRLWQAELIIRFIAGFEEFNDGINTWVIADTRAPLRPIKCNTNPINTRIDFPLKNAFHRNTLYKGFTNSSLTKSAKY